MAWCHIHLEYHHGFKRKKLCADAISKNILDSDGFLEFVHRQLGEGKQRDGHAR